MFTKKQNLGRELTRESPKIAKCHIAPGSKDWNECCVGSGPLVTGDVAPESVVVGNPTRLHMTRKEFEEKRADGMNLKKRLGARR